VAPNTNAKYEVEIVVFAYNAFDPEEEDLGHRRANQTSTEAHNSANRVEEEAKKPRASAAAVPQPSQLRALGSDREQIPRESFQFELLSSADFELTAEAQKLQSLGAYTVLLHGGWVQEGLPEEAAHDFDISIFGVPRISGTVTLYISRFAHVSAAVDYSAPVEMGSASQAEVTDSRLGITAQPLPRLQLRQTRRMRSGELHYLDHPAFGLLIMVRARGEPQPDGPVAKEKMRRPSTASS